MKFLLDSAALSEPTRKVPSISFMKALRLHESQCATCSIVWHELKFGVARLVVGARKDTLVRYLVGIRERIDILPYDNLAAEWHGEERARLEKAGRPAPFADGQIAAIAATRGLTLVTDNIKDFRNFRGLDVKSWW